MSNVTATQIPLQSVITHADIAQRAYDLYAESGYRQGQCKQNWQQAEKDLHKLGPAVCEAEHRIEEVFAPDSLDSH